MTKSNGKLCTCQVCINEEDKAIIPITDILIISDGVLDFEEEHDTIDDLIKKEKARLFINRAPGGIIEELVNYDIGTGINHIKAPLNLARSLGLDMFDMVYLSITKREDR